MSNRRFFCDELSNPGDIVTLGPFESHHAAAVIRSKHGDSIVLMDGLGNTAAVQVLASVEGSGRHRLQCRILDIRRHAPSPVRYRLHIAPPRSKPMRQIVMNAVQLGVAEIVPVIAANNVVKPDTKALSGWRRDAREACKQSGNPFVPDIREPQPFHELMTEPKVPGFVGCPAAPLPTGVPESRRHIAESLEMMQRFKMWSIELWIGPEGGFSADEQQALFDAGLLPLTIGNYTLRVETAVTACLGWLVKTIEQIRDGR